MGQQEARYRVESVSLFRAAGVSPETTRCSYYAKSLSLVCQVAPVANTGLQVVLQKAGWVAPNKSGHLCGDVQATEAVKHAPASRVMPVISNVRQL